MTEHVSKVTSYPKFHLSGELSSEHHSFFEEHGFIHFRNVLGPDRISQIVHSINSTEKKWVEKQRKKVNGVPIVYGINMVHRFPFMSVFSDNIAEFIHEDKIQILSNLLSKDSRIGEHEKRWDCCQSIPESSLKPNVTNGLAY